jgi:threonine/homoserine/homoserine lactone efflux protein
MQPRVNSGLPEWNFGLMPFIGRKMVFVSYVHVLSAAFLMGLAAAAPMGPVNMLAIRRGLIGGWRHTLAGIGSVTGDLILSLWCSSGDTTSFPTCPTLRSIPF